MQEFINFMAAVFVPYLAISAILMILDMFIDYEPLETITEVFSDPMTIAILAISLSTLYAVFNV